MIIFIILVAIIVTMHFVSKHTYDDWPDIVAVLSLAVLLITLITLPLSRADYIDKRQQLRSIKATIQVSRSGGVSDIERAAIYQKVIEANAELASAKYWNNTLIADIFIPDSYANEDYIK